MRKTILIGLLLFTAGLAAQAPGPTVPPPPVLTPVDPTPTIAMVGQALGQNAAWTAWAQKGIVDLGAAVDQIVADEKIELGETQNIKNSITGLQTQIAALPQVSWNVCTRVVPSGYVVHVAIPWMSGATVYPDILLSSGSSTAAKLRFGTIGSRYDYSVCVPSVGNYTFRLRSSISVTASGSYALHVESNGVNLASVQVQSTTTGWVTSGVPLALPAGPQILTLVVDAKGTAEFAGDWFELVKLQ